MALLGRPDGHAVDISSASSSPALRKHLPRVVRLSFVIVFLLITGLTVYFRIFTKFYWFDDEGYLMATIQAFLRGHLLYDQIYTLYGPFYYLLQWIFYAWTGLDVSHDSVRLIAMVLWPVSAAMIAWAARRISGSLLVSGFVLLGAARILLFFDIEPGHPEEICLILLACVFVLAVHMGTQVTVTQAVALGFLLSALAMTKVNIGLYATLALLLSLLAPSAGGRVKKMVFCAMGMSSMACIALIMSPLLAVPWARDYLFLVELSLLAALLTAFEVPSGITMKLRIWCLFGAAFLVTSFLILIPFLARGTSLQAFLNVTVIQHKDYARHWFRPSFFGERTVIWALFSLAVALAWICMRRQAANRRFAIALQALKAVLGIYALYTVVNAPVYPSLGETVMKIVGPFSWLLFVLPKESQKNESQFPRIVLCFFSVFLTLYAFPVSGSQSLFAIVPLIVTIGVFLHDAALVISGWIPEPAVAPVSRFTRIALLLLLTALYFRELRNSRAEQAGLVPLALRGADHIRVARRDAETYQWLTRELNAKCPSFFSVPSVFSLYFWTNKSSPTMLMMNNPSVLNSDEQQAIIGDLRRNSTTCIVYNPALLEFFRAGRDLSRSPLANYVRAEFETAEQRNGYYLMIRNDRSH